MSNSMTKLIRKVFIVLIIIIQFTIPKANAAVEADSNEKVNITKYIEYDEDGNIKTIKYEYSQPEEIKKEESTEEIVEAPGDSNGYIALAVVAFYIFFFVSLFFIYK